MSLRACYAQVSLDWQANAKDMLQRSMQWMDQYYDRQAGYMYDLYGALSHETRSSSWYAAGLLARNEGDDAQQAARVISNIISGQHRNASTQWYGDYQVYPEEPTVGTAAYPEDIYNTWDPNWRGFIGTAFIVILEEFPHLLSPELCATMLQSLHLDAQGDTYRVGGVDGDNLYPSYSNAAIMHTVLAAWVGRHTNDSNLTAEGERWASEITDLFDRNDTLSEFNSPTYAGVSLYGLAMWAKYLPSDSVLARNGPRMITAVWDLVGQLYNANMKNIAGPWDRSYGFDMTRYFSLMGLWIWSVIGLVESPCRDPSPQIVAHFDDHEFAPLFAILAPFTNRLIPNSTLTALQHFPGTHSVHRSAYSPAYDTGRRNISVHLTPNLTIGAESFSETVTGGPNINPSQWNPAVVQWTRPAFPDRRMGFITMHPTEAALHTVVTPTSLEISYPRGNDSSTMTFLIAPNPLGDPQRDVSSWSDIVGLDVDVVETTMDAEPQVGYCGYSGGTCDPIYLFEFWNFTYTMPVNSTAVPKIKLAFGGQSLPRRL